MRTSRQCSCEFQRQNLTERFLIRDKSSIDAISDACCVGAHKPEMICDAGTQPRDIGCDVLITIASSDLVGRPESIADCSSILKVHSGAKSVGIYCCIKRG